MQLSSFLNLVQVLSPMRSSFAFSLLRSLFPATLLLAVVPSVPERVVAQTDVAGAKSPGKLNIPVADTSPILPVSADNISFHQNSGIFIGIGQFDQRSNLTSLRYSPDDAIALCHYFVLEAQLILPQRARLAISGMPQNPASADRLKALISAGVREVPTNKIELGDAIDETLSEPLDESALLVITISSHGYEEGPTAFFMPSDGRLARISETGISMHGIERRLEDTRIVKARKHVVILDACRERQDGDGKGQPQLPAVFMDLFRDARGTAALMSCRVGQVSWESAELGHGVYTHFLLEALRGNAPTIRQNRMITIGDVSNFAAQQTRDWAAQRKNVEQSPDYKGEEGRAIPVALHRSAFEEYRALIERRDGQQQKLVDLFTRHNTLITASLFDALKKALAQDRTPGTQELVDALEGVEPGNEFAVRGLVAWWNADGRQLFADAATPTPVPATPEPTPAPTAVPGLAPLDPQSITGGTAPREAIAIPSVNGIPGIEIVKKPETSISRRDALRGVDVSWRAVGDNIWGVKYRYRLNNQEEVTDFGRSFVRLDNLEAGKRHSFQVQAYTRAGYSEPAIVTFDVRPNEPPTVSFVEAPGAKALVESTTLSINLSGTDPDGEVIRYQLILNDPNDPAMASISENGAFQLKLDNLSDGPHRLIAQSFDDSGAASEPMVREFEFRFPVATPTPRPTPVRTVIATPRTTPSGDSTGSILGPGTKAGDRAEIDLGGGVKMAVVWIPPGEFQMGSNDGSSDEKPVRTVRLTEGFWMAETETTVGQWKRFVAEESYRTVAERDGKGGWGYDGTSWKQDPKYTWKNTGFTQNDQHPVVNVSWNDSVKFTEWLGKKAKRTVSLPTEAQWEYACRAGTTTEYSWGDEPDDHGPHANIADLTAKAQFSSWTTSNARDGHVYTAPVRSFQKNGFGLYDMHGNVWEWCLDWYDSGFYVKGENENPVNNTAGSNRVIRGGSWFNNAQRCRSAYRNDLVPSYRNFNFGFRPVLLVP